MDRPARTLLALAALMFAAAESSLWATPAQNQRPDELKKMTLEQLANTEVTTVSKEPENLQQTPAAVFVLTREDIRRSGATSIPEALRLAPGVEVARINSSFWSVGVRGFGSRLSRSVLVLIDGRSAYTPLFAGVYWEVQDTLLDDIDRIEVIRGPGGTIWGANAVNGVINIITRKSDQTHGLLVKAGGGTVDQGLVAGRYGGGTGKFNYRFYAKGFVRGPEFHLDGRQFDDWHLAQGGFRTDWDLQNQNSLTIQGDIYNGDIGTRLAITNYSPPSVADVLGHSDVSGGNVLARWQKKLDSGADLQLLTYYDRTRRHDLNLAETRNTFDADFIHRIPLPARNRLTWGLGTRVSQGDTSVVVPTVVFAPSELTEKLSTAFLQDEIAVVPEKLTFTFGSKFEHNNYSGFEVQPNARISWTPRPQHTVWAAVSRAVRTPSAVETNLQLTVLAAQAPPVFFRVIGDGNFAPERMVGAEFGYRGVLGNHFLLDLATFFNHYDRLLSLETGTPFAESASVPAHLMLPFFLRNLVAGNTRGIEIAPTWEATRDWRVKASYSFLNLDLHTQPGSSDLTTVRSTEESSPAHQVTLQSLLQLPRYTELDLSYRYTSELPSQMVSAYHTADVRLGWSPLEHFDFSIVGKDLLQPHHAEFGGGVEVKRSVYGKITWSK